MLPQQVGNHSYSSAAPGHHSATWRGWHKRSPSLPPWGSEEARSPPELWKHTLALKASKENQENALLLLQALYGVGGDLKEHFKGSKEYRRVGIRSSQGRQHHADVRVFQHSTVDKCPLLRIIHRRRCFSIVVSQLVYLLEDKALLISDKKRASLFYKLVLGKTKYSTPSHTEGSSKHHLNWAKTVLEWTTPTS